MLLSDRTQVHFYVILFSVVRGDIMGVKTNSEYLPVRPTDHVYPFAWVPVVPRRAVRMWRLRWSSLTKYSRLLVRWRVDRPQSTVDLRRHPGCDSLYNDIRTLRNRFRVIEAHGFGPATTGMTYDAVESQHDVSPIEWTYISIKKALCPNLRLQWSVRWFSRIDE